MAGKPAWIFFLTNILQNQSVIFSIVGTAVYALLVAGALLSASYTFRKLKADRPATFAETTVPVSSS